MTNRLGSKGFFLKKCIRRQKNAGDTAVAATAENDSERKFDNMNTISGRREGRRVKPVWA